jgi:hypothetical protein
VTAVTALLKFWRGVGIGGAPLAVAMGHPAVAAGMAVKGLATKSARQYGNSVAGTLLPKVADSLQEIPVKDPPRLGKYGVVLNAALKKSPSHFATANMLLAQTDPTYQAMVDKVQNGGPLGPARQGTELRARRHESGRPMTDDLSYSDPIQDRIERGFSEGAPGHPGPSAGSSTPPPGETRQTHPRSRGEERPGRSVRHHRGSADCTRVRLSAEAPGSLRRPK